MFARSMLAPRAVASVLGRRTFAAATQMQKFAIYRYVVLHLLGASRGQVANRFATVTVYEDACE